MFNGALHSPPATERNARQSPRMSFPSRVLGRSNNTQNGTVNNTIVNAELDLFQVPLTSDDNCQDDPFRQAEQQRSPAMPPPRGTSTPPQRMAQREGESPYQPIAKDEGNPIAPVSLTPSPPCAPRPSANPNNNTKHIRLPSTNEIVVSPVAARPLITTPDNPRYASPQIIPPLRNALLDEAMSSPLFVSGPTEGGITAVDLWVLQNRDMLRLDTAVGEGDESDESKKVSAWVSSITAPHHNGASESSDKWLMPTSTKEEASELPPAERRGRRDGGRRHDQRDCVSNPQALTVECLMQLPQTGKEESVLHWMKQAAVYHSLFLAVVD